ncbi:MAG: hypothetical protein WCH34_02780 [Bacteroidota bacterium]
MDAPIIIFVLFIFGITNALIANSKHINPFLWFFCAGLFGTLMILILPSAKAVQKDKKKYENRQTIGNTVGFIIVGIEVVFLISYFAFFQFIWK